MKQRNIIITLVVLGILSACNQQSTQTNKFSLTISSTGEGTITSNAAGVNCSDSCDTSFNLRKGTKVILNATPAQGFVFAGWSGACTGDGACVLTMNSDKRVEATFLVPPAPTFTLNVTKTGNGTVTSSSTSIACGTTCGASFEENTSVTLTATPDEGFTFQGWAGDCAGNDTCQLVMNGNKNVTATFTLTDIADLLITEVSGKYYNDDSIWFEVKNTSDTNINLADYQLRSYSQLRVQPFTTSDTPTLFSLPALTIPAGDYAVIASQGLRSDVNGTNIVYVSKDEDTIPAWARDGFIEIVKDNATVDFVRFGRNTVAPLSAHTWQGPATTEIFIGTPPLNVYGYTIVRSLQDTDTDRATDWSVRRYPTAGGPNDVPADATDDDNDGIPDSAEVEGGSFAGLDLFTMGARQGIRDIFIEVDYMKVPANSENSYLGMIPQAESLTKVQEAFRAENIAIHFDTGDLYNTLFNLGNTQSEVPYAPGITIVFTNENLPLPEGVRNLQSYKAQNMDIRRRNIFHYMLMANSQRGDGKAGSSGLAEFYGNDFIVSIGAWNLTRASAQATNLLINFQASTIMHELGHNLGLSHAGPINDSNGNGEPNYLSIMNYTYQLSGLPDITSPSAGDRYYLARRWKDFEGGYSWCDLHNSPCSSAFTMSYSHGSSLDIDEKAVNESKGLGRGTIAVDYNNNNRIDTVPYAADLNPNEGDNLSDAILTDYDDWNNLFLPFYRSAAGNNLLAPSALSSAQPRLIYEPEPSQAFLNNLYHISH